MQNLSVLVPTNEAKLAVNNIKKSVKKVFFDLSRLERVPSKDLLEKRNYMQSEDFWNDKDNVLMWNLSQEVIKCRDCVSIHLQKESGLLKFMSYRQSHDGYILEPTRKCNDDLDFDRLGNRIVPPDLSRHNINLFKAKANLHYNSLKIKNEAVPQWCSPEKIAEF